MARYLEHERLTPETPDDRSNDGVTAPEFRAALTLAGYHQRGFAAYVGCDERTVHRWSSSKQAIPNWVPVMLALLTQPEAHTNPEPHHEHEQ